MYKLAYIEPCIKLLHEAKRTPYLVLNILFHKRLRGIEQGIIEHPEIQIDWINNGISVKQFIKSGEHRNYDAILLTFPDEKDLRYIEKVDDGTIFLISQDFDPGGNLNYIGPDHDKDARAALQAITREGGQRIYFVALHTRPKTLAIVQSFRKEMKKLGLPLTPAQIIGIDIESNKKCYSNPTPHSKWTYFTDEIIKYKDQADVFVFIDTAEILSVYRQLTKEHGIRIPEDIKLFSMQYTGQFPGPFYGIISKLSHIRQDYKGIGQLSIQTIHEILRGKRPAKSNKILVPGIFSRGVSLSSSQEDNSDEDQLFKASISHYIKLHYKEDITSAAIAKELNLNYSYCLNKFRTLFKMGIQSFINSIRMDRAAHLVANTNRNMGTIYMDVGFKNATTFGRQFKKRFGKSPSAYRKSAQKA